MKKILYVSILLFAINTIGFSATYSGKGLKLHGDSVASMGKGGTGVSSYGLDLFHLNPATISNYERIGVGLQYGNLFGGFINPDFSLAIPTSYGVFGTSFRYFNGVGPDFQTGYDLAFGGAKDFTKQIAIGASVNIFYGDGYFYFGASVGSIYKFDVEKKKMGFGWFDPSVGFSLNLGLPLGDPMTNSNFNSFNIGHNFIFFNHKKFNLSYNLDVSAVMSDQYYAVKSGIESVILKNYVVRLGGSYPDTYGYGNFTMGLGYKFEAEKFKGSVDYAMSYASESSLTHFLGVTAEYGALDRKPPVTKIKSDKLYLSPNHDGVQDYVVFDLNVEDQSRIKGWKLQVIDENKKVVKEFKTSDRDTIEGLTLKGFFKRILQKKTSLVVPPKVMWDGTDSKGKVVPDGKYTYAFNATDGRDNIALVKRGSVFIDNTLPNVKLSVTENLFSPNGDNKKDEFVISQNITSSPADKWKASLKDAKGKVVKQFSWAGTSVPSKVVWDGKDDLGNDVAEGVYFYHIGTTDKAGNTTKADVKEIILTRKYEIADIKLSSEYFSFQKNKDLSLFPIISQTAGLKKWGIDISDSDGKVLRKITGNSELPKVIKWNCKDNDGKKIEDGIYFVSFNATFKSGNSPKSFKKKIIIDSSSPEVELSHSPELFSPDGDGENDVLTITSEAEEEFGLDTWKIEIFTSAGALFKSFTGTDKVPTEIKWDGLSETKDSVESASDYFLKLTTVDKAGNIGATKKNKLQIDILVIVTERGLKMRISNIEFALGSHKLKRKGRKILNRVKELLDKYKRYDVIIEGHTDDIGKDEYNLKLSERRAKSVLNYMVKRGIEKQRLQFFGMGETVPLYENSNNENRRRNRRVEFLLIKKEK